MAGITVDDTKVRLVQKIETENVVLAETIAVGAWVRYDANGKVVNANATSAAEAKVIGILISKDGAGNRGTVVRKGLVEIGGSALSAVAYGDPVYLSNTDGASDTAAGTVSTVVAKVAAVFGGPAATASKLLRVDL